MEKKYLLKGFNKPIFRKNNVVIEPPFVADKYGRKILTTDNLDMQMIIETHSFFGRCILLLAGEPFSEVEKEKWLNKKDNSKEESKKKENAINPVEEAEPTTEDNAAAKMEHVEGVNSLQKAFAFFEARSIKYPKGLTVAKAKELAAENNILFVDWK